MAGAGVEFSVTKFSWRKMMAGKVYLVLKGPFMFILSLRSMDSDADI